jgi:hypothetical protein
MWRELREFLLKQFGRWQRRWASLRDADRRPTQVNYSSIRAGLLEFRRRCEAIQHGVFVHQLCRPIWRP